MVTLIAKNRDVKESLEDLRTGGHVPAVYYGNKKQTTSITVPMKDFVKVWKEAGESSTIVLETEGGKIDALIHEVQMDPIKHVPVHVDFLAVDANKEIEVKVAIEFTGEAPAVKSGVGMLIKVMHEIEIKALPKNLPHVIEVDLSSLAELHSQIHVKDVKFPTGVTPVAGEDEVVASISEMKEEKEEEAAPVDLSAIELSVEKGKKDEEAPAAE